MANRSSLAKHETAHGAKLMVIGAGIRAKKKTAAGKGGNAAAFLAALLA